MKKILLVILLALAGCQKEVPLEEANVIDTIEPVLTEFSLLGSDVDFLIKDEEYIDPGVSLTIDNKEVNPVVESNILNKNIGTYSVNYSIPNEFFSNTLTRTVIVVKSEIPIELLNTSFNTEIGSDEYNVIKGVLPQDNSIYSLEITNSDLQVGENNVSLIYKCKRLDAEIEFTIDVMVTDTQVPIITSPKSIYTHPIGLEFNHQVVQVEEASEYELNYTGQVDINTEGTYPLVYTAVDSSGNRSEPFNINIEIVKNEAKDYFEQYLFENTFLYDSKPFTNSYMYDVIEWAYRGVVVENNEFKLKYFFFLHNEIEGEKVLKKIGFGSNDGDNVYSLIDSQVDYVFEMPLEKVRGNNLRMYTFAHDEYESTQREWVADFSFNDSKNLNIDHILSLELMDGAKK